MDETYGKSLEELDGHVWGDPPADATKLIERVHHLRSAPLEGAQLDADAPRMQLLIGVRRDAGAPLGMIEGVRVNYRVEGTTFQADEPWALAIYEPGTMPSSTAAATVARVTFTDAD